MLKVAAQIARVAVKVQDGARRPALRRKEPPMKPQPVRRADEHVLEPQTVVARPLVLAAVRIVEEALGQKHGSKDQLPVSRDPATRAHARARKVGILTALPLSDQPSGTGQSEPQNRRWSDARDPKRTAQSITDPRPRMPIRWLATGSATG